MLGNIAISLLIGFFGLVGAVILYITWEHLRWKISPGAYEARELSLIRLDVNKYFGFLFDKGYRVVDAGYDYQAFGNWWVTLESKICKIYILQDRLELTLSFAPKDAPRKLEYALGTMIYFVSGGRKIVPNFEGSLSWGERRQFERLSALLKEYHDQIVDYLGKDFEKHKSELDSKQITYGKLLMSDFEKKHHKTQ